MFNEILNPMWNTLNIFNNIRYNKNGRNILF